METEAEAKAPLENLVEAEAEVESPIENIFGSGVSASNDFAGSGNTT